MTLPGITEAAEQGDWTRAAEQVSLVADAISSKQLNSSTASRRSCRRQARRIRWSRGCGRFVTAWTAAWPSIRKTCRTGERVAIDADSPYETFSVIKVPLMAAVLERVREGKLSLSDRVTLKADQRRMPSGVLYTLDPGLAPTVRDLLTLMIIISDNEATDALGDLVGRDSVTDFMKRIGLPNTSCGSPIWTGTAAGCRSSTRRTGTRAAIAPCSSRSRSTSDAAVGEAFRKVIEETGLFFGRSTARETGRLFAMMAKGELVSSEASALMVSILKRQQVNNRFPRYLGADVDIAHKTGDGQPWVANDAGILWIKGTPIVLVVFAGHHRGTTEQIHDAEARIAAIVAAHFGASVPPSALSSPSGRLPWRRRFATLSGCESRAGITQW